MTMKKIIISLLTTLIVISSNAQVRDCFNGILPVTDRSMTKSLNGEWKLKVVNGVGIDTTDRKSVV